MCGGNELGPGWTRVHRIVSRCASSWLPLVHLQTVISHQNVSYATNGLTRNRPAGRSVQSEAEPCLHIAIRGCIHTFIINMCTTLPLPAIMLRVEVSRNILFTSAFIELMLLGHTYDPAKSYCCRQKERQKRKENEIFGSKGRLITSLV
jgi:hypothetical protein